YRDIHTDRRVSAAQTLGMLESEAGMLALVAVLEDPAEPSHLKEAVAEALERLQDFRAVRAVEQYRGTPHAAEFGQVGFDAQLASSSRSVRRSAIEKLGEAESRRTTDLLLQALDDPEPELRALAIKELRGREDERIRPALIALIARERERDRSPIYFAIDGLRGYHSPEVVDALLRAYRRLPAQRSLLLGALAERPDPRSVDVLLEALRDPDGELSFAAKQGLTSLASRRPDLVVEPLILMLASTAPLDVKRTASDVLGRSTGQDFGLDVATWDEWYRHGRR
ncbi:MAG: HEAT repeat domain-containing protein, partial [Myxococcota bacterium]